MPSWPCWTPPGFDAVIDFNWTEIALLLILGVIFFGPEKLPDLARRAARILAYLRDISSDARSQLRAELGPEFDDIRLADLNPKSFVSRHLLSADDKADLLAIRDDLREVGREASSLTHTGSSLAPEGDPVAMPAGVARGRTPFDPEAT